MLRKNLESARFALALAAVAVALVLTLPASAGAAEGAALTSIGPRIGFGFDPDQVVFGGQMAITGFAPDFSFQPVLELGVGDNVTVVATSFDVLYSFRLQDSDWRPFAGAGIGVDFFSSDRRPPNNNETATEAGLNLIVGASIPARSGTPMFFEMRIGMGALPEVKGMLGWNFSL